MTLPIRNEQRLIFNLIADLVQDCIAINNYEELASSQYRLEDEEIEYDEVSDFIQQYHEHLKDAVKLGMPLEVADSIREWCKNRKGILTYRIALSQIDSYINTTDVFETWENQTFESLNENNSEILVELNDHNTETRWADGYVRKTAHNWTAPINRYLQNVFIVKRHVLQEQGVGKYRLSHHMIKNPPLVPENAIIFGVSPLINDSIERIMDIELGYKPDSFGNQICVFRINDILIKERINKAVVSAYHLACLQEVDILIMPEMLGYPELCNPIKEDGAFWNQLLRKLSKEHPGAIHPKIILMPTVWHNNQNVLQVYSREGKLLLTQYKQHPFEYSPKEKEEESETYQEDLVFSRVENEIPKNREICILHIQNVGRMAFPICIDYLHGDYRDILVQDLKANFLLCPSFSPGNANFELASSAPLEYGVRTIWCNSCSARHSINMNTRSNVGVVCLPSIGVNNPVLRLNPDSGSCQVNCPEKCLDYGCVFRIRMPLNCANPTNRHDDSNSSYKHFVLKPPTNTSRL